MHPPLLGFSPPYLLALRCLHRCRQHMSDCFKGASARPLPPPLFAFLPHPSNTLAAASPLLPFLSLLTICSCRFLRRLTLAARHGPSPLPLALLTPSTSSPLHFYLLGHDNSRLRPALLRTNRPPSLRFSRLGICDRFLRLQTTVGAHLWTKSLRSAEMARENSQLEGTSRYRRVYSFQRRWIRCHRFWHI